MNNEELKRLLKSARVPEREADYWEDFPRRVLAGVEGRRRRPATNARRRWSVRIAWGVCLAMVCIAVGFWTGQRHGARGPLASNELLQNEKLIRELMSMFPNRVRAVVQDEEGLNLVLSEQPDVPRSQPLWVRICRGDKCLSLVTFSGQELQIAGQQITVLSDARGGVILEGDRFAWASSNPGLAHADLTIRAHPLELAAL